LENEPYSKITGKNAPKNTHSTSFHPRKQLQLWAKIEKYNSRKIYNNEIGFG